jgi:hypothetical protein
MIRVTTWKARAIFSIWVGSRNYDIVRALLLRLLEELCDPRPALLEDGVENLFLVLEVVIDQAIRDARLAGDVGDARSVDALAAEYFQCRIQNLGPLVVSLRPVHPYPRPAGPRKVPP